MVMGHVDRDKVMIRKWEFLGGEFRHSIFESKDQVKGVPTEVDQGGGLAMKIKSGSEGK